MNTKHLLAINLHLFEGEGVSATGGTFGTPADAAQGKTGEISKVIYGKQSAEMPAGSNISNTDAPAAEGNNGANAPKSLEERQKAFDDLINSEDYKDIYTKRTQEMIDRRFAKSKATEAENGKLREIADILGQKYGISDDADFSKLRAAIESDDDTWAAAAEEAGMTVEQYRRFDQLQRKNAAYEAARQNDVKAQQDRQKAETWQREAVALKQKYPQFDLRVELGDRNFVAAMQAGVPMELIYTGKYHDQLMSAATQNAAKKTEQNVVNNIRAKGNRPAENGAASQGAAFTVKSDPSKLTLADFDEIARRVRNGENITY